MHIRSRPSIKVRCSLGDLSMNQSRLSARVPPGAAPICPRRCVSKRHLCHISCAACLRPALSLFAVLWTHDRHSTVCQSGSLGKHQAPTCVYRHIGPFRPAVSGYGRHKPTMISLPISSYAISNGRELSNPTHLYHILQGDDPDRACVFPRRDSHKQDMASARLEVRHRLQKRQIGRALR